MNQNVSFITIATPDLDAARAFYVDGLGWVPLLQVPGEIIFFQVGHGLVLGLFDEAHFVDDLSGGSIQKDRGGFTLSNNVGTTDEVDAAIENARRAGATILKEPQPAAFGGYHAHFADPMGTVWEVAVNPGWRVLSDGTVDLNAVE